MDNYSEGWIANRKDWHFLRRLYARYGLVLRDGEIAKIKTMLRLKQYVVRRSANSMTGAVVAVKFRDGVPPIVVAIGDDHIKTALPSNGARKKRTRKIKTGKKSVYVRERVRIDDDRMYA